MCQLACNGDSTTPAHEHRSFGHRSRPRSFTLKTGRPDYCRGLERNGVDQIAGNLYATAQTFIAVGNNCANANGSPLIPNVAVKFDESIVRAGISYKFG